ncbi:MAG: NAD-dependent epimerase/dehydratase family protein [Litoreibacter sp.]
MRVLLTGGSGMVGQAMRRIAPTLTPDIELLAPTRAELPLQDRYLVADWFADNPIDAVIHIAARVGGIQANIDHPVDFLIENLRMNDAVIHGAHDAGVERLIYLGSSCMYPRDYRQPLREEDVLAAPLEPTNEGYALAKIAGAKLCEYISSSFDARYYRAFIPCNLFGMGDHFATAGSHLMAAIVTKIVDARDANEDEVEIWGSGDARREFIYTDDLVSFLLESLPKLETYPPLMNLGHDTDHSVKEYYQMAAEVAGYQGRFTHDLTRPEGMMHKCMTSERANAFGWRPKTDMREALARTIKAYEAQKRGDISA